MRVFVEGSAWRYRTGVARYAESLLKATLEMDKQTEYTIFGFTPSWFQPRPLSAPNLRYRFISWFPRQLWNLLHRELNAAPPVDLLLASRPDIVFFPNFVRYPLAFGEKSVVVIHDLSYLHYPEFMGKLNHRFLTRFVPKSIAKADAVVAVSEFTKQDLVSEYGLDPAKITVIPNAVDHAVFSPASSQAVASVRKKHGLPEKFILHVGTFEGRKNHIGLMDAYAKLPGSIRDEYALVLAGGQGWKDENIRVAFDGYVSRGANILRTGFVTDEELPALYTAAALFVFPSFYEGFGIPALEAMACGTPVITADNSSLPEVVGDAGLLVPADDTAALSAAIERVLSHMDLSADMAARGLKQAGKYTWAASAENLLKLLGEISK